jgi:pimeloyl-ACP methyl ester carboxylesterase
MSATIAPLHRGGSGSPLVIYHGFTGSWRVWRRLLPDLEDEHDVLAPSLLGHAGGTVPGPGDEISIRTIADDAERVLDQQGIEQAHLAGNSLGGWLSLELGRRGRALSVTALSPAGGWNGRRELDRVVRLIRNSAAHAHRAPGISDRLLKQAWARRLGLRAVAERGDRVSYRDAIDLLDDARSCVIIDAVLDWVVADRPLPPREVDADYPITIGWADRDRMLPFDRYGRPLLENIGPVELVRLPGCGHVPMLDDPALVSHTILTTTRRVDETRKAATR